MSVFGHHPHDLLSEWHHFVTGALVVSLLVRRLDFTSWTFFWYRVMITLACDITMFSLS